MKVVLTRTKNDVLSGSQPFLYFYRFISNCHFLALSEGKALQNHTYICGITDGNVLSYCLFTFWLLVIRAISLGQFVRNMNSYSSVISVWQPIYNNTDTLPDRRPGDFLVWLARYPPKSMIQSGWSNIYGKCQFSTLIPT